MEGIPMRSAGISTSDRERTGIREGALFSCRICGIMAYTLMLASVDAPVWATIEFVMGTLFMVVGVWCVYLAGMEYDYQMEKRRYRNKR